MCRLQLFPHAGPVVFRRGQDRVSVFQLNHVLHRLIRSVVSTQKDETHSEEPRGSEAGTKGTRTRVSPARLHRKHEGGGTTGGTLVPPHCRSPSPSLFGFGFKLRCDRGTDRAGFYSCPSCSLVQFPQLICV